MSVEIQERVEVDVQSDESARPSQRPNKVLLPLIVVIVATVFAQLVSLAFGRADEQQRFGSIVLPSVLFLSAITVPLAGLGIVLGRRINLGTPLLTALLFKEPGSVTKLGRDAAVATVLGLVLGGLLLLLRVFTRPYLPAELPAFGHRGIVGGLAVSFGAAVAEEVWFRLGLMTVLIACLSWFGGHSEDRPEVAWPVIVLTSVGFGLAHLPQLMSYGAGSTFAIGGTIIGNSVVGMLYGWCYWRRSLIAAIVAHFAVDLVLHVFPAIVS